LQPVPSYHDYSIGLDGYLGSFLCSQCVCLQSYRHPLYLCRLMGLRNFYDGKALSVLLSRAVVALTLAPIL
jgi:hypothetical protein